MNNLRFHKVAGVVGLIESVGALTEAISKVFRSVSTDDIQGCFLICWTINQRIQSLFKVCNNVLRILQAGTDAHKSLADTGSG